MPDWRVVALIAAGHLPDHDLQVLDCLIRPLPGNGQWTPQPQLQVAQEAPVGCMPSTMVATEPQEHFFAHHVVSTVVTASSERQALSVSTEIFKLLSGSLALVATADDVPPVIVPFAVAQVQDDHEDVPTEVEREAHVRGFLVRPLSQEQKGELGSVLYAMNNDPVARQLVIKWQEAETTNFRKFRDVDRAAALIGYCHVIELAGETVTIESLQGTDQEQPIAEVAVMLCSSLQQRINTGQGARRLAGAIDTATKQIERIKGKTVGSQIQFGGEAMGMDLETINGARESWRIRSTRAAHPGPAGITDEEVQRSRRAAAAYLGEYLRWRTTKLVGAGGEEG